MSDHVPDPAALRGETLSTLATAYEAHRSVLVRAMHGNGEREPAGRLRGSALSALAIIGAILEHMLGDRAVTIMDALRYGAPAADVAAAAGLEVDEVLVGTRAWLGTLGEHGTLGADELDEMAGILDRAEAAAAAAPEVVADHAVIEHLGGGGAPDPDQPADEWLAALVLESRRGEPADGEVQP